MTTARKPRTTARPPKPRPPESHASEPAQGAAPAAAAHAAAAPEWKPLARIPYAVRWGDLDAFNHVNNAAYLVYVQEARLEWLAKIEGPWFGETMMPVVASAHMNYRRQLSWPARIVVELATARVGTSSVTIAHRIVADTDGDASVLYADGEVVMVWIDPASGRPVPLPDAIRAACQVPAATSSPE